MSCRPRPGKWFVVRARRPSYCCAYCLSTTVLVPRPWRPCEFLGPPSGRPAVRTDNHSRNNASVVALADPRRGDGHNRTTPFQTHPQAPRKGSPAAGQVCVLPIPPYGFIRFLNALRPWRLA